MSDETPLAAKLRSRIARDGPLTLHDFMDACLADPEHGYYRTRDPLGARGDFITAPEISQIFGELIGLWSAETWRILGAPDRYNLVELGPGRGTLMADALRAAKLVPAFLEASRLHLVETSPVLRAEQKARLGDVTPHWHDMLESVPDGPAILIANEFLDALPVRQFERGVHGWFERCVTATPDGFAHSLAETPLGDETLIPEAIRQKAQAGQIAEIRPATAGIVNALAARAEKAPLAALFIDYGHVHSAPGETLQAVAGHGYSDPLQMPGAADLTAHVDFAALAAQAGDAGLAVQGPLSQNAFLMALGLPQRCDQLMRNAEASAKATLESGAVRLVDPDGMGSLFKVMVLCSQGTPPLPAFGA